MNLVVFLCSGLFDFWFYVFVSGLRFNVLFLHFYYRVKVDWWLVVVLASPFFCFICYWRLYIIMFRTLFLLFLCCCSCYFLFLVFAVISDGFLVLLRGG